MIIQALLISAASFLPGPAPDYNPPDYKPSDSDWDRLAQCESGGNWSANTGNGYSGGLQFSNSTWRANGGPTAEAWAASRSQQIAVAERLYAQVGWSAWPGCSAQLGLSGGGGGGGGGQPEQQPEPAPEQIPDEVQEQIDEQMASGALPAGL